MQDLYKQNGVYMEGRKHQKGNTRITPIWKAKRNMEIERRIKWYNLSHKGEDTDKVQEDNLEHKQSNM